EALDRVNDAAEGVAFRECRVVLLLFVLHRRDGGGVPIDNATGRLSSDGPLNACDPLRIADRDQLVDESRTQAPDHFWDEDANAPRRVSPDGALYACAPLPIAHRVQLVDESRRRAPDHFWDEDGFAGPHRDESIVALTGLVAGKNTASCEPETFWPVLVDFFQ